MSKVISGKNWKNCKMFLEFQFPSDPELYLGQTKLLSRFAQIFRNMQHFPNHCQSRFFFLIGIGPDILKKVFEYYIVLLIWANWVLFNFYIKQKRRFSVWNFTENTLTSPLIKEFCQKQKHTKKMQVSTK